MARRAHLCSEVSHGGQCQLLEAAEATAGMLAAWQHADAEAGASGSSDDS